MDKNVPTIFVIFSYQSILCRRFQREMLTKAKCSALNKKKLSCELILSSLLINLPFSQSSDEWVNIWIV